MDAPPAARAFRECAYCFTMRRAGGAPIVTYLRPTAPADELRRLGLGLGPAGPSAHDVEEAIMYTIDAGDYGSLGRLPQFYLWDNGIKCQSTYAPACTLRPGIGGRGLFWSRGYWDQKSPFPGTEKQRAAAHRFEIRQHAIGQPFYLRSTGAAALNASAACSYVSGAQDLSLGCFGEAALFEARCTMCPAWPLPPGAAPGLAAVATFAAILPSLLMMATWWRSRGRERLAWPAVGRLVFNRVGATIQLGWMLVVAGIVPVSMFFTWRAWSQDTLAFVMAVIPLGTSLMLLTLRSTDPLTLLRLVAVLFIVVTVLVAAAGCGAAAITLRETLVFSQTWVKTVPAVVQGASMPLAALLGDARLVYRFRASTSSELYHNLWRAIRITFSGWAIGLCVPSAVAAIIDTDDRRGHRSHVAGFMVLGLSFGFFGVVTTRFRRFRIQLNSIRPKRRHRPLFCRHSAERAAAFANDPKVLGAALFRAQLESVQLECAMSETRPLQMPASPPDAPTALQMLEVLSPGATSSAEPGPPSPSSSPAPARPPRVQGKLAHALSGERWAGLDLSAWEDPNVSPADVQLVDHLGDGGYSQVWSAELRGSACAVKLFSRSAYGRAGELVHLASEMALARELCHPSICQAIGTCVLLGNPALVMELLHSSLKAAIYAPTAGWPEAPLDLGRRLLVCAEVADALAYMHARGCIHRDVKVGNVLLTRDCRAKLADLSIATRMHMQSGLDADPALGVGSHRYMAPEVIFGPYGLQADVYAFGLLLHEVLHEERPFDALTPEQVVFQVHFVDSRPALRLHDALAPVAALIEACWDKCAERRPDTPAVLAELTRLQPLLAAAGLDTPAQWRKARLAH